MIKLAMYAAIAAFATVLTGCDQHYRYPCQNPANWSTEECQKPLCEVNRSCTEHIFKESNPAKGTPVQQPQGVCK